jgi:hypothetical protein
MSKVTGHSKQTTTNADHPIGGELFEDERTARNNLIFAVLMTILLTFFVFLYGFLFRVQPEVINISSIATAIALAMLIVPGTPQIMQGSDSSLATPASWSGAVSGSTSSSWPSA